MEDSAVYQAAPAADRRELVAPVAAWLVSLGFQVVCGPVAGGKTADVTGVWRGAKGEVFELRLVARAAWAMCECSELVGTFTHVCFAWTLVESVPEVQWLLTRSRQYRQATAPADALPGAARG